jgi:hypothetical protein
MALGGKGVSCSTSTDPNAFGLIAWRHLRLGASF